MKASFATNGAIADRYPELVKQIADAGHEIIAHSTDMNGTIASGMAAGAEAALIESSLSSLEKVTGKRPDGWLSIARSQSFDTPDLLKAAGVKYCCDWVNDELPYRFKNELINLQLNHELSDRQIVTVQQQSADSYAEAMSDAFGWLVREAAQFGGRKLPMHITPYIMGLPYRIASFEALLADLTARPEAWFATGGEIVSSWEQQQ
ncbi:polysaccharide deacetylase family protein [Altererythrobacter sp. ZODW24]|uniref:polysaccharide deacetylase family protein n=1 Tax=Altererythrobacter sp. ZODW24 TaxID=2185142 RepID=UPI000DF7F5AE|nr:polysaccharide deacetylase family protein [Altererythrobacter sp. ZODW24]